MLESKIIFASYSFGDRYLEQQHRLKKSILAIYPDANLYFVNEEESTGKPKFQQSLYGFKVKMVEECLKMGFKKIIFLDTAITLVNKVDYWFDIIKDYGVLSAVDRTMLNHVTSDNCLNYLGLTRHDVSEWHLLGGSVYVFDFDLALCCKIFGKWAELESRGLFGQQEDLSNGLLQGHRMDETCMALAMRHNNVRPLGHDVMRYGWVHPESGNLTAQVDEGELIVLKRHFK